MSSHMWTDRQTHGHDEDDRRLLRLKADAPKILIISEVRLKQTNQVKKKPYVTTDPRYVSAVFHHASATRKHNQTLKKNIYFICTYREIFDAV
jgi:hypothetical protein